MREMKDSGIEWIGEIPSEWQIIRFRFFIEDYKAGPFGSSLKMDGLLSEGDILVYAPEHIANNSTESDKNLYLPNEREGEMSQFLVEEGDILFPIVGSLGRAMMIDASMPKGIINQRVAKFKLNNSIISTRYFMRLFANSNFFDTYIDLSCRGSFIVNLTKGIINDAPCVVPDMETQEYIADYLDDKCSKIDSIIEKQQKIIEKLKEYKLSIITEAVTKGLNPDAELKDSEIEWIGEMPITWKKARIKFNYYLKGRIGWQGLKANEFIEEGPYLVTGTDFCNGKVNWSTCYHISQERFDEAPEIHVKKGDLLITKDGTVGKVAYIDEKPEQVSLNSHLLIMRPLVYDYSNRFLFWVIQSNVFKKYFGLTQYGTIMASLSQEKINDFSYVMPSVDEQIHIANYLDEKCEEIQESIYKRERIIEQLRAYKKSLIYEVVTGKKEV